MEYQDEYVLDNSFQFENKIEYAGFWTRFAALLIDVIILAGILYLVTIIFENSGFKTGVIGRLIVMIFVLVYKPFMEYLFGATIGKMAVKIKVVDTTYHRVDLGKAVTRNLPWILWNSVVVVGLAYVLFGDSSFTFNQFFSFNLTVFNLFIGLFSLLVIVSCLFVFSDPLHQGLHDKLANTYVIYK